MNNRVLCFMWTMQSMQRVPQSTMQWWMCWLQQMQTMSHMGRNVKRRRPASHGNPQTEAAKPPVEKSQVKDPGNEAKRANAKGKNRPADAPAGSIQCIYCHKWLPHYHVENCPEMPYETWINATKARAIAKHGAPVVQAWTVQCQHLSLIHI